MCLIVLPELPAKPTPGPKPADACQPISAMNIVFKGGERLDAAYDAGKKAWAGMLTSPGLAPLTATAADLWDMLRALADQGDKDRARAAAEPTADG